MPKIIKRLAETKIRNAPIKAQAYTLSDGEGLSLIVRPTGSKTWQYDYQFMGKWKTYTVGQYPLVGSTEAREMRDGLKKLRQGGIDPSEHKKAEKLKREYEHKNSFEALAREWHSKQNWVEKHALNIISRLEKDIFPCFGNKPVSQISRLDVLDALQKIEERGAFRTLLDYLWLYEGWLPDDDVKIARLLRITPVKWKKLKRNIGNKFYYEKDKGLFTHERTLDDLGRAYEKSETNKRNGQRGGLNRIKNMNSTLANAQANGKADAKANTMQSLGQILGHTP